MDTNTLRQAANTTYLITDETVARELHEMLFQAADLIDKLQSIQPTIKELHEMGEACTRCGMDNDQFLWGTGIHSITVDKLLKLKKGII